MIQAAERSFSVISTIQFLVRSSLVILVITLHCRESVGVMVMCWTLNIIKRSWVRSLQASPCCVLEQDTTVLIKPILTRLKNC